MQAMNGFSSVFIVAAFCCCLLLILIAYDSIITVTSNDVVKVTVLWIAALLGGCLFDMVHLSLLGSLIAGILLQNICDLSLPSEFIDWITTISLCTILLMSSLEISIEKIMQVGTICLRLTTLPGMIEALTAASLGVLLFDMPFTLALALGYILSAVSPAIVVPSMISLKNLGYGAERGIPTLVMAAASFDDLAAITGFTVSIGIALDSNSENIFLSSFIHGPVQLFIGVGTGLFMGVALATTRFCLHQWQRTLIALELSVLVSYLFKCIHLDGVGAGQSVFCFSVN